MAERGGFEPPVRLPVRRFSKPLLSATQPPLRYIKLIDRSQPITAFYILYAISRILQILEQLFLQNSTYFASISCNSASAASTWAVCCARKSLNFFCNPASLNARIATAINAAFFAPALPAVTVPTGIPGGI